MKKLISLICVLILLPIFAFAELQEEYVNSDYVYDWGKFVWNATQTADKDGNWSFGYMQDEDEYHYIPRKPEGYSVPKYLRQFPILNKDIDIDTYRSKERNFIRLIKCYAPGWDEDEIVYGVTSNNEWIVVDNRGYFSNRFQDKFQPYEDARLSIIKTIKMHCELEHRNPTVNEKYIILYFNNCKDQVSTYPDMHYKKAHQEEYDKFQRNESIFFVLGNFRFIGWCLLILFVMLLPAIIFIAIALIFPKGSIFSRAVTILDMILGVSIFAYWFGNKRK